jgi:RNA polymerase sigma-70 factor (ECF subfamily)
VSGEREVNAIAQAAAVDRVAGDTLVARARGGDLPAFEQLYRRHAGRIYALCRRMSGDPGLAEDQTQETFVRAWRKLDSLRGDAGFSAWLRRVAINVVLGDRRSQGRRAERERPVADPDGLPSPGSPVSDGSGLDLEKAIGALPARAREVFVLHDVEGYRHQEIARWLGITVGTTKAQLHRARRKLRERLR